MLEANPPQRGGAGVAEHGAVTAGKHGRHPAAVLGEGGTTDDIDTAPHLMQAARPVSMFDFLSAEAKVEQLPPRHHIMLPPRQSPRSPRFLSITWRLVSFPAHRQDKSPTVTTLPLPSLFSSSSRRLDQL